MPEHPVTAARFSPDGRSIATASDDGTVRIFTRDLEPVALLHKHFGGVNDVAWSPDSRFVASAGDDKLLIVWDVVSQSISRVLRGHTHAVTSVRFNYKGNLLSSTSVDENVRLWDIKAGKSARTLTAHSEAVIGSEFSYDGTLLVTGAYDGLIRIWDTQSGHCLRTLAGAGASSRAPLTYVGFTPNAQYILASSLDGHTRLWSYMNNQCVKDYDMGTHDMFSRSFIFVGRALLLAGPTGVAVWDIQSSTLVAELPFPGGAFSVDYSAQAGSEAVEGMILLGGPQGLHTLKVSELLPEVIELIEGHGPTAVLPSQVLARPKEETNGHAKSNAMSIDEEPLS